MCGKVIVAASEDELKTLDLLHGGSQWNGNKGINKLLPYEVWKYDGDLMDDFVINNIGTMIHVINTPSTAATSSLAIGEYIANIYLQK